MQAWQGEACQIWLRGAELSGGSCRCATRGGESRRKRLPVSCTPALKACWMRPARLGYTWESKLTGSLLGNGFEEGRSSRGQAQSEPPQGQSLALEQHQCDSARRSGAARAAEQEWLLQRQRPASAASLAPALPRLSPWASRCPKPGLTALLWCRGQAHHPGQVPCHGGSGWKLKVVPPLLRQAAEGSAFQPGLARARLGCQRRLTEPQHTGC